MISISDDPVRNVIFRLNNSAIRLKEKYDRNEPENLIYEAARVYLADYNHLESLAPKELLQESSLDKNTYWVKAKPSKSLANVSNICSMSIIGFFEDYIEYLLNAKEAEIFALLKKPNN